MTSTNGTTAALADAIVEKLSEIPQISEKEKHAGDHVTNQSNSNDEHFAKLLLGQKTCDSGLLTLRSDLAELKNTMLQHRSEGIEALADATLFKLSLQELKTSLLTLKYDVADRSDNLTSTIETLTKTVATLSSQMKVIQQAVLPNKASVSSKSDT
ncbi:hypothetical protein [Kistimonas asteriae]|uniref:hypothetical protein n=1 Tax=Kistimonas asteriae TaxID=517724 RepID=UPI001BA5D352|nr:hypothetical protein [Kistimonas asteriae]